MNPAQSAAQPIGALHPLFVLKTDGWYLTSRSLASPAPDGTVAYYFDFLSKSYERDEPDDEGPFGMRFDTKLAEASCQYLKALALSKNVEVADGPFIQRLEDDGCVPAGYLMLRAIVWADEFDLVVELDG